MKHPTLLLESKNQPCLYSCGSVHSVFVFVFELSARVLILLAWDSELLLRNYDCSHQKSSQFPCLSVHAAFLTSVSRHLDAALQRVRTQTFISQSRFHRELFLSVNERLDHIDVTGCASFIIIKISCCSRFIDALRARS